VLLISFVSFFTSWMDVMGDSFAVDHYGYPTFGFRFARGFSAFGIGA
jgi:hypothetical protein